MVRLLENGSPSALGRYVVPSLLTRKYEKDISGTPTSALNHNNVATRDLKFRNDSRSGASSSAGVAARLGF